MNRKAKVIFILAVLFLAFFLRLLGIGYGLPDLSHPDEARVILDTLSMGHRMSLLPERPDYALFYRYFLLMLFGIYYLLGHLIGVFKNTADFALKFMINPGHIYLIARFVSVIFGTAIGLAAYFLGNKIFKKEAIAILAMVFCLFEFQLLQHSQWAIYPVILCFFTLPAFYCMFKLLQGSRRRDFALAGAACGLAISIQNQGIYLIPSLLLSLFLNYRGRRDKPRLKETLKCWGLCLVCLFVFSLLGNFYWFFIFHKSLAKTMELFGVTRVGFSSAAPYNYNFLSMSWWFLNELVRQDRFLGVLMVLGICYSIFKRTARDLIFLAFLGVYLWAISHWGFRILHDAVSLLPITCIFASRFIVEIAGKLKKRSLYYGLISCLAVFPLINDSLDTDIRKLRKDTRQIARDWIESNIPAGSKVAIDWPIYSVPLKGGVPFLFRNPVAERYFNENLPPDLRNRYRQYLKTQKTYSLYEIMYSTQDPAWPKEMPHAAIEKARKENVYRDLYSRFHFKSIKDLEKEGVQYIIIASYAWDFFLLDKDHDKKNFFNPFFKDRPELNYHHADRYIDDGRHGIIYFLVKSGREFYRPLLDNAAGAGLIKEFQPGPENLGPTIKIFELK